MRMGRSDILPGAWHGHRMDSTHPGGMRARDSLLWHSQRTVRRSRDRSGRVCPMRHDVTEPPARRLINAVKAHGVRDTVGIIGRTIVHALEKPHLGAHLQVPLEMLKHPRHASKWMGDRLNPKAPATQALPWIAWPCIDFMNDFLTPERTVFEWGGGGSTLFFLKKGCRVTTVESSAKWVGELEAQIDALGLKARKRWDLRYVPLTDGADPAFVDYIRQVGEGAPWDLIMVDGWSRLDCLREGLRHVKVGGALVLDNANQKQFESVPSIMGSWERHRFRGLGVARSWVTQTDAYVRTLADSGLLSSASESGAAPV